MVVACGDDGGGWGGGRAEGGVQGLADAHRGAQQVTADCCIATNCYT